MPAGKEIPGGVRFPVRVQPGSARNRISLGEGDLLRVNVTAPPVAGRANDTLRELLAEFFGVRPGAVRIVSGLASRRKEIEIAGISLQAFAARFEPER
ncbi:MAG: DUF167 domain-containing protein [Clostridia bacterium]|nr:MAG: DUF167 domain-containing protein [Clostridia bacterium]